MSEPLLIVDVQEGFLNEYTHHIPGRIAQLIDSGKYQPLLFTRFINSPGSPYHRFLDWHECQDEPDTRLAKDLQRLAKRGRVFIKKGFAGLRDDLAKDGAVTYYLNMLTPTRKSGTVMDDNVYSRASDNETLHTSSHPQRSGASASLRTA